MNLNNLSNIISLKKLLYGGGKSNSETNFVLIGGVVFITLIIIIIIYVISIKSKADDTTTNPSNTTNTTNTTNTSNNPASSNESSNPASSNESSNPASSNESSNESSNPASSNASSNPASSNASSNESNSVLNYKIYDNNKGGIAYNNGQIIGSSGALVSSSNEWNADSGIFTASINGVYLITASFYILGKANVTRIGLYINNNTNTKLRYAIIEGNGLSGTLRTYSRVELLSIGDTVSFKIERGDNLSLYFGGGPNASHTNINITKLNVNTYYNLIENSINNNITYNNGQIIGSNSGLVLSSNSISTSNEWNSTTGVFTASSNGIYLINASFYINKKDQSAIIRLYINDKYRCVLIEDILLSNETLRTYSRLEQLSNGDKISFKLENGNDLKLWLGADIHSHTNITITKLNVNNYYNIIDNDTSPKTITYNQGDTIGSSSALISTSTEWNSATGVFTVSTDGIYLINASFYINKKAAGTRIALFVNGYRYAIINDQLLNIKTHRTFSSVETLSRNNTIKFVIERGNGLELDFNNNNASYTNISIVKLN